MSNDSQYKNNLISFEKRYNEISNEELTSILCYRNHFQRNATEAAIKEAIKRGIISSEEDLNSEEFAPQELPKRTMFPTALTESQNNNIFKSLCRIFYGFGLVAVVFGVYKITGHLFLEAGAAILLGLFIIFITIRLDKTKKQFYSNLLLALNIPALGYAIYAIASSQTSSLMDAVVIGIVILILIYTSFYINKLLSFINK